MDGYVGTDLEEVVGLGWLLEEVLAFLLLEVDTLFLFFLFPSVFKLLIPGLIT